MRLTFKELKDEIAKIVPKSIDYRVDLEAGNIAIVTPVPEKFGGGDGLVGKIAKKICKTKKRHCRNNCTFRIWNDANMYKPCRSQKVLDAEPLTI